MVSMTVQTKKILEDHLGRSPRWRSPRNQQEILNMKEMKRDENGVVLVDSVRTVSLLLAHSILWQRQKSIMLIWRTEQGLKASNPVPEAIAPSTSVWPAESNFSTCPKPSWTPYTQTHASQDFLCPHTTTNNAVSLEKSLTCTMYNIPWALWSHPHFQ